MRFRLSIADLAELVDLSVPGAEIGVCFRLHGCQPVDATYQLKTPDALALYLRMGWIAGVYALTMEQLPLVPDEALASAREYTLAPTDRLYKVATDYDAFQHMREHVRDILEHRNEHAQLTWSGFGLGHMMAALSLWLVLHRGASIDGSIVVESADLMRSRMRYNLETFNRAICTIACSDNRAYVQNISHEYTDLSQHVSNASAGRLKLDAKGRPVPIITVRDDSMREGQVRLKPIGRQNRKKRGRSY